MRNILRNSAAAIWQVSKSWDSTLAFWLMFPIAVAGVFSLHKFPRHEFFSGVQIALLAVQLISLASYVIRVRK